MAYRGPIAVTIFCRYDTVDNVFGQVYRDAWKNALEYQQYRPDRRESGRGTPDERQSAPPKVGIVGYFFESAQNLLEKRRHSV
jgi:hypothetical protein